jgi:hypothetical protein
MVEIYSIKWIFRIRTDLHLNSNDNYYSCISSKIMYILLEMLEIAVNITKSIDSFIGIRMWHILMNVQWE